MYISAIRGATTVNSNEAHLILSKTKELLMTVLESNCLDINEIVSIVFTSTKDLTSVYPAVAARELGMTQVPLICCQEMHVENSLPMCIRILMHIQCNSTKKPTHIYLEGAVKLRPDLTSEKADVEDKID